MRSLTSARPQLKKNRDALTHAARNASCSVFGASANRYACLVTGKASLIE